MLQLATDGPPVFKDRWTVLGTIDDTGSACDYLVWDRGEERWCMLRMLSFQSSRDSLARGRFEREMRLLERLDHPM